MVNEVSIHMLGGRFEYDVLLISGNGLGALHDWEGKIRFVLHVFLKGITIDGTYSIKGDGTLSNLLALLWDLVPGPIRQINRTIFVIKILHVK